MQGRAALALAAAAVLGAGLAACGGSDNGAPGPGASQLTVYSSLPLQGAQRLQSASIINAEKLALAEVGGRVGPFTVKYVSLDDSRGDTGAWDPGTVLSNARQAVEDRTAIAYLGELDSGASAIAVPVLNEAGVLTVSPGSTYPGLTTSVDADKGEPEKYYPSGARTFARVVPADNRQARAQVQLQRAARCARLFVVGDRDVYGRGVAAAVGREADAAGIDVVGETSLRKGQSDFTDAAAQAAKSGADCVFTGVTMADGALALYGALHAAAPAARLFGPSSLANAGFAAGLAPDAARRTTLTSLAVDDVRPSARTRAFVRRYTARYGRGPEPLAIYGYAAMKAVLDAIGRAGNKGNHRDVVVARFFGAGVRPSVLGPFAISKDGDTSLDRYAVMRIAGGRLVTSRVIAGS